MNDLRIPLGIPSLEVISQDTDNKGNIVLTVQSIATGSRCHKCGKHATKRHGYAPPIEVRHLPIFDTPVYLKIKPVRYQCEHCDDHPTTTEQCEPSAKLCK